MQHIFQICQVLVSKQQQQNRKLTSLDMSSGKKTKKISQTNIQEVCNYSLYLLGIFVANEYDDWVDVNTVKTFNGVRSNVK